MSQFGDYSRYYDLLYKDKDYQGEAAYVEGLIRRFAPSAHTILNLGCGTGAHDLLLCQRGYTMTGVDRSPEMLAMAKEKLSAAPELASLVRFQEGDVRTVRLGTTFDVVTALFHVLSYQPGNDDVMGVFETAKSHLNVRGVFLFDCWYGPAVLTQQPVVRVKRLENDLLAIKRIAEPVPHPEKNLVDVQYTVFVTDKQTGAIHELHETHTMRYLFTPEIEMMLTQAGFKILACEEWMTKKTLGSDTWGALFVCQSNS